MGLPLGFPPAVARRLGLSVDLHNDKSVVICQQQISNMFATLTLSGR